MASILEREERTRPAPAVPPASAGRAPATGVTHRVLKIAPTCFFADYGCHVRILEEALALKAAGHRVSLCTYDLGRPIGDIDICRVPRLPWRDAIHTGSTWHKLYLDALLALRAGVAALGGRPTVVHAHLHEGALIGRFIASAVGAPLVFDFQGSLTAEMLDHNFLSQRSPLFWPLRTLERQINRMADVILTSSTNARDLLLDDGHAPDRVVALQDCVSTERFRPRWEADPVHLAALQSRWELPPGRKVVAYLGLLAEYQGLGHLLTAARHLLQLRQDVHFLIMGHPGEERYRRAARDLGIAGHVTFTGRVPYEDAPEMLCLGDVAVSPKFSLTEANGKLLNYMAVGLPTVVFDTPVSREILGPLGRYARTGDHIALAEQLSAALDDPDAPRQAQRLRRRAEEHFSWQDAGERLAAIYAGARAGRSGAVVPVETG